MPFYQQDWWQQLFVLPSSQVVWWAEVVRSVLRLLLGVIGTVGVVPILVWLERRMLGWLQGRLGPNRVGPQGLLQPLADALKLMLKEDITPVNVDRALYYMAPGVALAPVIMSSTVLPWGVSPSWGAVAPGLDIGILFLLAVASIEVYGVIMAGWSSNNKYSLLGGLRASSQVISYELGMGLAIIAVLLMTGTLGTQALVMGNDPLHPHQFLPGATFNNGQGVFNIIEIANSKYTFFMHDLGSGFWDWNVFRMFPYGLIATGIYLISMIAETNRAPFDLPEAETELVAGFHTEYTSFKFAMFFMGEYANMLIVSWIAVTLFFGGWLAPWGGLSQLPVSIADYVSTDALWFVNFINSWVIAPFWLYTKLFLLIGFFILVRASFPRLRYDMLMRFGWKGMLPVALVNIVLIAVSLAVQEQVQEQGGGYYAAWWIGQIVSWLILGVILALTLRAYYTTYKAQRAVTTESDALVPIRRPTTRVAVEPSSVREK